MWRSICAIFSFLAVLDVTRAAPQAVQIERQVLLEMPQDEIKTDASLSQLPISAQDPDASQKTKAILDKIGLVNARLINEMAQEATENLNDNNNAGEISPNKAEEHYFENLNIQNYAASGDYANSFDSELVASLNEVSGRNNGDRDLPPIKRKIIQKVSYLIPNVYNVNYQQQYRQFTPFDYYRAPKGESLIADSRQQSTETNGENRRYPPIYQTVGQSQWSLGAHFVPVFFKTAAPFIPVVNRYTGIVEYGGENKPEKLLTKAEMITSIKQNPTENNEITRAPQIEDNRLFRVAQKDNSGLPIFFKASRSFIPVVNRFVPARESKAIDAKPNSTKQTEPTSKNLFGVTTKAPTTPPPVSDEKTLGFLRRDQQDAIKGINVQPGPSTITNPGFVIRRLRVKHGGVAIAGPGGVATAGRGGTAIVGPGGVAYTKPSGVAIAGPGAKVIALPDDIDLNRLVEQLSEQQQQQQQVDVGLEGEAQARAIKGEYVAKDSFTQKKIFLPAGARIVATGPSVYRNNGDEGQQPQIVAIPFYGGAKGQVLQITRNPQGEILQQSIVPESANTIEQVHNTEMHNFAEHLNDIQTSAQRLVELQEKTKRQGGRLRAADRQAYASNLEVLGAAATSLAQLGAPAGGSDDHDFTRLFLEDRNGLRRKADNVFKKVDKKDAIRQEDEDEEDVGEQQEGGESPQDNTDTDGVQVNGPSDTASVAEAKPVGVAIAGEGGVASSKPVATAVVGPGGLAIARPVATAIAGVDPNNVGLANKVPVIAKQQIQQASVQAFESQPYLQYVQYPQYLQYQMEQHAYPPFNFAIV